MEANGKTGTVQLSGQAVTFRRNGSVGWRATTGASEKRIPVGQILAIHLMPASLFGNGSIRFVVTDANASARVREGEEILFTHRQQAAFEALAREVTRAIAERPRLAVV